MSNHQVLEWLNENELRCYPLQETGNKQFLTSLSLNRCIVDASLVYTDTVDLDAVRLEAVVVSGNSLTFTITNQTDFTISDKNSQSYPGYIRNSQGSLLVVGAEVALISSSLTFSDIKFEPCCLIDVSGKLQGVQSITAGGVTVVDNVILKEGSQFGLQAIGQTINMTAGRSFGKPITCQNYFSGTVANDCESLISFINGASPTTNPGTIVLKAGPHARIFDDQDNHRIYIGLDFDIADVCKYPLNTPPKIL